MATMTQHEATGEREFCVPFDGPLAGAPFQAPGELVIRTAPPAHQAQAVLLRFYPSAFEFQARLPALVAGGPLAGRVHELGLAASQGRPVVTYAGSDRVVGGVPAGMADLAALEAFLTERRPAFVEGEYALDAIEFEIAPPRG